MSKLVPIKERQRRISEGMKLSWRWRKAQMTFDRVWYWRKRLPGRKGQRCRIVARGKMNSALIEFEDGYQVISSRYAVRKAK